MPFTVHTPQSLCQFGLARCDITPPVGVYHRMWGAATHDRSTGIHRPLTATACVFRPWDASGDTPHEQILVAVDHCLLWAPEMAWLLETIAQAAGVPSGQVVVTFSHTHAAGLMDRGRGDLPGGELIAPYLEQMNERIAQAVIEARRACRPATVAYATGRCDLAAHRDLRDDARGQWVCGFNPAGQADDAVFVARVTDAHDRLVATFVNYACHPTTLAWQNTLISPDFPGAMRELVEGATGVPCVFVQGVSGDIGPRHGFVGDTAVADRNGRQLGHAALAALEALPPPRTRFEYAGPVVSGATIGTWEHRPLDEASLAPLRTFRIQRWTVPLEYRPGRASVEELQRQQDHWQQEEARARRAGDDAAARDSRAMVERMTRALTRARMLPPADTFPYPVTLWQMGSAVWLMVEGEPYQRLQTALRDRFAAAPILIGVLANGSRCSYLPPRETYGTGIYQETIAVLAPGSLEALLDSIAAKLSEWLPAG
ncbi:MAG TPA: hypothetical protein VML55_06545 [Planctomycetaceae bacterium]|nr:hypothetical protein [Planctomycetaceae bacterium]